VASLAFIVPIIPGKEQTDQEALVRFASGDDKEAFAAWNGSHGVRRHAVWHQTTPNGTVAIVLLEADDPGAALGGIATSQAAFDQRFRDLIKDVHGVDLANDPPAEVVPVIDWRG
jgi:hypothetical protein